MPTCLITGANKGIGLQLCLKALSDGWTVYGSTRRGEVPEGVHPLIFDVTDHNTMKRAVSSLLELDLLINNAGIIGPENQATLDMDFEGFLKTFEINTLSPLALSQTCLPALLKSKAARIITISSQMSFMGYAKSDRIAYRASKAAVNKVMQGLATDLKDKNIAVTLMDPGWVRTDMGGSEADLEPDEVARGIWDFSQSITMSHTGKFFKWTGEQREF